MREAKCPACRKRFSEDAESTDCARCGADLSLLMKLRRHAAQLATAALAESGMNAGERMQHLKKAQFVYSAPVVRLFIRSLETNP